MGKLVRRRPAIIVPADWKPSPEFEARKKKRKELAELFRKNNMKLPSIRRSGSTSEDDDGGEH